MDELLLHEDPYSCQIPSYDEGESPGRRMRALTSNEDQLLCTLQMPKIHTDKPKVFVQSNKTQSNSSEQTNTNNNLAKSNEASMKPGYFSLSPNLGPTVKISNFRDTSSAHC